jgi:hypothetical protein
MGFMKKSERMKATHFVLRKCTNLSLSLSLSRNAPISLSLSLSLSLSHTHTHTHEPNYREQRPTSGLSPGLIISVTTFISASGGYMQVLVVSDSAPGNLLKEKDRV